jgi:tRNA threonylcarbamoyladenosine biosynthesis protein TsaE
MQFEARNEEEMIAAGRALAAILPPQGTVSLTGDLGAGKTTLVKGIASARAGIPIDDVSSPTFTLIHEYGEPLRVCHVDLYRLEKPGEVLGLGLDEYFERHVLVLIEWGERFERLLPPPLHRITISVIPLSPDTFLRRVLYISPEPSVASPSSSGSARHRQP